MSTRVELGEMETTRAEKFLAFVLAAFLLIGGLWMYFQPLDTTRDEGGYGGFDGSPADQVAVGRHDTAKRAVRGAVRAERARRDRLELAREDYRTALEAGRPAGALEARYRRARAAETRASDAVRAARAREAALAPAAGAAERRIEAAQERATKRADDRRRSDERETFALRLAWVLACLAAAFWLFNRQRRDRSRYLPIGMAAVGFATVQALVMAADYTTDYIDVADFGPLLLSLAGIAFTAAAFVGLQRYLARRLPQRRVRRRECPFCGYPVSGNDHCEGCGREVVAECAVCSSPRRVGTEHCGACGSA